LATSSERTVSFRSKCGQAIPIFRRQEIRISASPLTALFMNHVEESVRGAFVVNARSPFADNDPRGASGSVGIDLRVSGYGRKSDTGSHTNRRRYTQPAKCDPLYFLHASNIAMSRPM